MAFSRMSLSSTRRTVQKLLFVEDSPGVDLVDLSHRDRTGSDAHVRNDDRLIVTIVKGPRTGRVFAGQAPAALSFRGVVRNDRSAVYYIDPGDGSCRASPPPVCAVLCEPMSQDTVLTSAVRPATVEGRIRILWNLSRRGITSGEQ